MSASLMLNGWCAARAIAAFIFIRDLSPSSIQAQSRSFTAQSRQSSVLDTTRQGYCASQASLDRRESIDPEVLTLQIRRYSFLLGVRKPSAIFTGCLTAELSKCSSEMTLAGEPQTFGDSCQMHPGLTKHLLSSFELGFHHILMRRCSGRLAKDPAEIRRRHARVG